MRVFIFAVIVLVPGFLFSQDTNALKRAIDAEVQHISTNTTLVTEKFSIQALKKVLHYINYELVRDGPEYVKISRQFAYQNDSIGQVFYLKKGELIYAEERIVSYYIQQPKTDSITWSGSFYFSKNKLINQVTLGHGKLEMESWNLEQELLMAVRESRRDIRRFQQNSKR